jgi:hypothetical protein
MEIIRFHEYTPVDKEVIIERHLIPQVMNKYFGSSALSRIKCIIKGKTKIMARLIFSNKLASNRIGVGIIKKKLLNNKTSGIRRIIRKLDKAIARINLQILESGRDITKIKKITLTARMF